MGCGSSKEMSRSVTLHYIGVPSVDSVVDQVVKVLDDFYYITFGLYKKKHELSDLVDLKWNGKYGDGALKKAVLGILLQFFSVANGDLTKVKIAATHKKPYLKVTINGLALDKAAKQIDTMGEFIEEIFEAVLEKLPKLIAEVGELVTRLLTAV